MFLCFRIFLSGCFYCILRNLIKICLHGLLKEHYVKFSVRYLGLFFMNCMIYVIILIMNLALIIVRIVFFQILSQNTHIG